VNIHLHIQCYLYLQQTKAENLPHKVNKLTKLLTYLTTNDNQTVTTMFELYFNMYYYIYTSLLLYNISLELFITNQMIFYFTYP